ncbi:Pao retrotransposon peptidase family protein [Aphelenchoides avenae]|nr:Pao retrotransposon peptidase family protein [Aphelenchus avenae]
MTCLEGTARQAVEGLAMTDKNCGIAIDLLMERFGKEDAIKQALHKELRELKKPDSSAGGLRRFLMRLERLCRQLEEFGEELNSNEILFNLQAKLPADVQNDVVKAKQEATVWNTGAFRATLSSIVDLKEEVERTIVSERSKSSTRHDSRSTPQPSTKPPKASAVFASVVKTKPKASQKCHFCRINGHWSTECRKFGTFELRSERVKELQLCFRCLAAGHMSSECRSSRSKCYNCDSQQHHTSLCRQPKRPEPQKAKTANEPRLDSGKPNTPKAKNKPNKASSNVFSVSTNAAASNEPSEKSEWYTVGGVHVGQIGEDGEGTDGNALLLTKRVPVFNCTDAADAQSKEATLFLDCGSHKSFIREDLAESLGLKAGGQKMLRVSTITTKEPEEILCNRYEVGVRLKDGDEFKKLDLYGLKKIVGRVPVVDVKPLTSSHPKGHRWKLQLFPVPDADLLIGADHFWSFQVRQVDELKDGINVIDSEVSYMVTGTLPPEVQAKVLTVNVSAIAVSEDEGDAEAHAQVVSAIAAVLEEHSDIDDEYVPFVVFDHPTKRNYEVFWRTDLFGIGDDPLLNDDEVAEKQYAENVKHNGRRYQVPYLWKSSRPKLPNTRPMCKKQLNSQWHALRKEPGALEKIDAIFKTQLEQQIIEIPDGPAGDLDYCLPWLVVRTPHKTTPLRIVYDASARLKGYQSLNDQMYRGPVILPELPGLIMALRTGEIVVQGDVEKAFLSLNTSSRSRRNQVLVAERHPQAALR